MLARARAAGLEAMIAIGTEPGDWGVNRDLARAHPGFVHYTVGLHPCCVDAEWARAVAQLEGYWPEEGPGRPVALGETGLDRFHLPKDPDQAARVYGWQRGSLRRAAGAGRAAWLCPVVIPHSREAFADCVGMIDASSVDWRKVVFHCFSEGAAELRPELARRGGRALPSRGS